MTTPTDSPLGDRRFDCGDADLKPVSVAVGELAVAAGVAGRGVAVWFLESAADVDCALWRYCSLFAGESMVLHVDAPGEVRKLRRRADQWRLVLVHEPRLFAATAWALGLGIGKSGARPSVFVRGAVDVSDDLPIPLLTLRATPPESAAVAHWFADGRPGRCVLAVDAELKSLVVDPAIDELTSPGWLAGSQGDERLDVGELVAGLLRGAALTVPAGRPFAPRVEAHCGRAEYRRVRRLLNSPMLRLWSVPVAPLAVEMVARVNALITLNAAQQAAEASAASAKQRKDARASRNNEPIARLTTRNEVADLGNTRGRPVVDLLTRLQQFPGGDALFAGIGLLKRPPERRDFRAADPRELAKQLRPWSYKQVRTQFDALQQAGLIGGERCIKGAWQYRLPAELTVSAGTELRLPAEDAVFYANAGLMDSADLQRALRDARPIS